MPDARLARTRENYKEEDHAVGFNIVTYEFICHCGARLDARRGGEDAIKHLRGKDYRCLEAMARG